MLPSDIERQQLKLMDMIAAIVCALESRNCSGLAVSGNNELPAMTEQRMKTIYRIITTLIAAVLLFLPQTAGAQKNIKVALALSKDLPGIDFVNGMYEVFKRDVESRTNGALTIEIFYGGALGNPINRMDQMRNGTIQMSDASDGNYATIFPEIQVLNIPYLFATEQNAWEVLDGPFGRKLAEDLRTKTGIRVLGWWESGGFKHFSSNKALRSPADFAGLKIRALGPLAVPLIEALKASVVPIGFGELYTALSTGLVDVQENSLSVFRLIRLQEVHKFILLSGHSYSVGVLGINNAFYIQLSPDERAAVDAAALKAIAFNRDGSRKAEQEAIAALRAAGIEFIELTSEQKQEFRRITQGPVIEWLKTKISVPDLIGEALLAVQAR
jgi:tripartite ATP-independent transporter DctP family solute receptor